MSQEKHTPGPMTQGASSAGKTCVWLGGATEPPHEMGPDTTWIDCNTEANARRIAACWNFCEGIPTSKMEGNTFEDYVAEQAFINGMAPSEEGMTIGVNGLAAQLIAASFAGQFVGSGAINYLSINMKHREIGEFVVTMQRKKGITPAEKLKQVKDQRDELLEYLQYAVWAHPELEKNEKLMAVIAKATTQQ